MLSAATFLFGGALLLMSRRQSKSTPSPKQTDCSVREKVRLGCSDYNKKLLRYQSCQLPRNLFEWRFPGFEEPDSDENNPIDLMANIWDALRDFLQSHGLSLWDRGLCFNVVLPRDAKLTASGFCYAGPVRGVGTPGTRQAKHAYFEACVRAVQGQRLELAHLTHFAEWSS